MKKDESSPARRGQKQRQEIKQINIVFSALLMLAYERARAPHKLTGGLQEHYA
jgi:hypothetical protein